MLFSLPVDGQVYAQPLYLPGVAIPNKGVYNVVYVATENDSLYAFDADHPGPPLWQVSLGTPANCVYGCTTGNLYPLTGITATPVIDPSTGTIYVVNLHVITPTNQIHYLHAIDVATGKEKLGGPVRIQGRVPGGGEGGTTLAYSEIHERLRPALTLTNGLVIVGTGSYNDWGPYHGWLFAYSASTLQQVASWNSTPNGNGGSMWQSGAGFVVDDSGYIYLITANGDFDGVSNFGDSFVKISSSDQFQVVDYFTPSNQAMLSSNDIDLGNSGPMRIPGTNYLVGGGKEGKLYLLDITNMGRFSASTNKVLQEFQVTYPPPGATGHIHCSPVYWNGPAGQLLYVWGENGPLKAYLLNQGLFQTTPVSQSAAVSPATGDAPGMPGGCLSVSSNGGAAGTGIVWGTTPYSGDAMPMTQPGILRAFDAANLSNELWNSKQNAGRDDFGNFAKFVSPTVVNGKVYLATFSNQLAVYGLVPTFGLSPKPTSQTITAGGTTTFAIGVNAYDGFTGVVNLSVPKGTSATFSPASLTGSGSATLTVTTMSSTPPGNYPITVTALSGSITQTETVEVVVSGFSLSASPTSQSVTAGGTAGFNIEVTALNGFSGVVNLSVPKGTSASFSPASLTGSGSATLTVTTTSSTPPGNYPITVTATSGTETKTASVELLVNGFTLSASPSSQIVAAGNTATFTIGVTVLNGFTGVVNLSVPKGTSATFSAASLTGSGSSTLTVTTTSSTPPGNYPVTVSATSETDTKSVSVELVVNAP